jgi:hypothetical protein
MPLETETEVAQERDGKKNSCIRTDETGDTSLTNRLVQEEE